MNFFQTFSPYTNTNFNYLEKNLDTDILQKKYYDNWLNKYKEFFKTKSEKDIIAMACRMRRAKKEILSASQAYIESTIAKENSCLISYYYLIYYSLIHAMQSVLYLNTDIGEEIVQLSHDRIRKLFIDYYCKGNKTIISSSIHNITQYRYFREYYSYNTPFNMINGKVDNEVFITLLKECLQLANFHSLLLEKSGKSIRTSDNNIGYIYNLFKFYNAKIIPNSNQYETDAADDNTLFEFMRYGVAFECFSLDLEHDFDEYGGYGVDESIIEDKDLYYDIKRQSFSFVFKTLYWGD